MQSEKNKNKRMKRSEDSLCEPQDVIYILLESQKKKRVGIDRKLI